MIKIGILGGSFNPPHEGHIHISNLAIKKLSLKQLWWIPATQNPFKNSNNFPNLLERVKLCQKITYKNPKIRIKAIDNFYTINLINKLTKKYKSFKFIWIMGADNLANFHKWHKFDELIEKIEFVIFARQDFILKNRNCAAVKLAKKYHKNQNKLPKIQLFNCAKLNISSTAIRTQNV